MCVCIYECEYDSVCVRVPMFVYQCVQHTCIGVFIVDRD